MRDNSKVLDRIKKLLALAGNNPNEAEASAAMEKVQAMLAEHNLSMSDVSTHDKAEDGFVIDGTLETDSRPWRRQLAVLVGRMYFCTYFFDHRYEPRSDRACGYVRYDVHNFVGARHNVAVVHLVFKYLNDAITRLAKAGAKSLPVKERAPYMNSFRHACADRLCFRIEAHIAAASRGDVKKANGTNLPALASLYENTQLQIIAYMDEQLGEGATYVPADRSKSTSFLGKIEGDKAGKTISLKSQVTGAGGVGHLLSKPGN